MSPITPEPDQQDDAPADATDEGSTSEDQGVIVTARPPREDAEPDCAPDDAASTPRRQETD